jgi:hypothetical protein
VNNQETLANLGIQGTGRRQKNPNQILHNKAKKVGNTNPTKHPGERRVCRYLRGNQNPLIEDGQTTQWPKEKGQKKVFMKC